MGASGLAFLVAITLALSGAVSASAAIPSGNVLQNSGSDDHASVADNSTLDLGDVDGEDFTIETFFFVPDTTGEAVEHPIWKNFAYGLLINYNTATTDAIFFRFWTCAAMFCQNDLFNTTNLGGGLAPHRRRV